MLLDGITMEDGTVRGEEKVTRRMWKSLVLRLTAYTLVTICCLSAASYFKYTNQLVPNVICCSIVFLSASVLAIGYSTFLLKIKSDAVLRILLRTITMNSKRDLTMNSRTSEKDLKLKATYENLKVVLPFGFWNLVITIVLSVGLAVYALASITSDEGMAWSSPLLSLMHAVRLFTSFIAVNKIFIKW